MQVIQQKDGQHIVVRTNQNKMWWFQTLRAAQPGRQLGYVEPTSRSSMLWYRGRCTMLDTAEQIMDSASNLKIAKQSIYLHSSRGLVSFEISCALPHVWWQPCRCGQTLRWGYVFYFKKVALGTLSCISFVINTQHKSSIRSVCILGIVAWMFVVLLTVFNDPFGLQ